MTALLLAIQDARHLTGIQVVGLVGTGILLPIFIRMLIKGDLR